MQIGLEPLFSVAGEIEPLLEREWQAAGEDHENLPFDPNWDAYVALERAGALRVFTVRDGKRLVGHLVFAVSACLHSKTVRTATSDALWIEPDARRPGVAMRLFRFAEAWLRDEGVRVSHIRTNTLLPAAARIAEHEGYREVARVHSKVLSHA